MDKLTCNISLKSPLQFVERGRRGLAFGQLKAAKLPPCRGGVKLTTDNLSAATNPLGGGGAYRHFLSLIAVRLKCLPLLLSTQHLALSTSLRRLLPLDRAAFGLSLRRRWNLSNQDRIQCIAQVGVLHRSRIIGVVINRAVILQDAR